MHLSVSYFFGAVREHDPPAGVKFVPQLKLKLERVLRRGTKVHLQNQVLMHDRLSLLRIACICGHVAHTL